MTVLLSNKHVGANYDILEKYSAGIKLSGAEVKALKTNAGGSLVGSFIILRGNELFIKGMHIPPYQAGNTPATYDPYQLRKILVRKRELQSLTRELTNTGLTIVPLSVHNTGRITLSFALVRGKKKHDKRETLKKREDERQIQREFKIR